jgi:hypothetical protein
MKADSSKRGSCPTIEPLLSSYAAGALDEPAEGLVRDHLVACDSCRAAQAGRDPSVLFLELRRVPLPEGFLDTFAAAVRRRVESDTRRRWLPVFDWTSAVGVRRLAYVAAPVMTLLLLGTLFLVRPGGFGVNTPRKPGEGTVSSPFVVPPGSARFGKAGVPAPEMPQPPPGLTAASGTGAPPLMEEIGSPGARVYRFMVESGGNETPIYFVVDESIDI